MLENTIVEQLGTQPKLNDSIETLEFQSDLAYRSFQKAVSTSIHLDAAWSRALYQSFADSLREATGSAAFLNVERGNQDPFERYRLQFALGNNASRSLQEIAQSSRFGKVPPAPCNIIDIEFMESLTQNPYGEIMQNAGRLVNAHRWDLVLKAFDYVRDVYLRPQV